MFRVELIGNLGRNAEIKNDNGRVYVQFSVAHSSRFTKADGTVSETTMWATCFYRSADAEVVKYLKAGIRVYVRGNADLRLYSSEKDRRMKAGISVNVTEIELVGSASDPVPRQLVTEQGQIIDVMKWYYVDIKQFGQDSPTLLYDRKGSAYGLDKNGIIQILKSANDTATGEGDNK